MYNTLREKVNLLLEDSEFKVCPVCHEMIDNCKCETTQEAYIKQERTAGLFDSSLKNEYDSLGTDENYVRIAKKILKKQKKLGKLKSVKVQVLSLDESRKKRLKSTGILMGTAIGLNTLAAAFDYRFNKKTNDSINTINRTSALLHGDIQAAGKFKTDRKALIKDSAKKAGIATGVDAGLAGLGLALSRNNLELVIICDYEYGKKILPLFSITETVDKNKAIRTIGSNVNKAVKKLQKSQEWSVKEDVSDIQFMTAQLKDLLVENVLNY